MKWIVTSRVNDGIERKECDTEEKLKSMVQLVDAILSVNTASSWILFPS
jgi:hypothetical protein